MLTQSEYIKIKERENEAYKSLYEDAARAALAKEKETGRAVFNVIDAESIFFDLALQKDDAEVLHLRQAWEEWTPSNRLQFLEILIQTRASWFNPYFEPYTDERRFLYWLTGANGSNDETLARGLHKVVEMAVTVYTEEYIRTRKCFED